MTDPEPLPATLRHARAEHARLAAVIAAHDVAYHRDDAPTVSDADYDALRRRLTAIEGAFPALDTATEPERVGRRQAVREIRDGPASRAHAVARQRLRRRGSDRVHRAGPAFPRARCRCPAGRHRGAQDRRALLLAPLRGGPVRRRRHPRRRLRGRGCDGQRSDRRGHSPDPGRTRRPRRARRARRDLHDEGRLRGPERAAAGGRPPGLRQSAQLGRGIVAPARPCGDGGPALAVLRLCLGRGEQPSRRDPIGHDRGFRAFRSSHEPVEPGLRDRRRADHALSRHRGPAVHPAL